VSLCHPAGIIHPRQELIRDEHHAMERLQAASYSTSTAAGCHAGRLKVSRVVSLVQPTASAWKQAIADESAAGSCFGQRQQQLDRCVHVQR
jgi:hypothetical protein